MRVIATNKIRHRDGSRLAIVERDHDEYPYIIVGIDKNQKPMTECGFKAYNTTKALAAQWGQYSHQFDVLFSQMR